MTKEVKIGKVNIGGGNKVAIQSMTTTATSETTATINQINDLALCGADIVRIAILDENDAKVVGQIVASVDVPIVCDIHFDYKLAIKCLENGAAKVRINPGNIGGDDSFIKVINCAKKYNSAIRIGVNSGSIEKRFAVNGATNQQAMLNSLKHYVDLCEKNSFFNVVLSVKSSDVKDTIQLNRQVSSMFDYPLHIGVTEAGSYENGLIKSSIGIGALLADGIGDTIRVSLTDQPQKEVVAAKSILKALKMTNGVNVISCPTCGRCKYDVISLANSVEKITQFSSKTFSVAVMGCIVNGPGEAKDAELGIAGGEGKAVIFKKGQVYLTLPFNEAVKVFTEELSKLL